MPHSALLPSLLLKINEKPTRPRSHHHGVRELGRAARSRGCRRQRSRCNPPQPGARQDDIHGDDDSAVTVIEPSRTRTYCNEVVSFSLLASRYVFSDIHNLPTARENILKNIGASGVLVRQLNATQLLTLT